MSHAAVGRPVDAGITSPTYSTPSSASSSHHPSSFSHAHDARTSMSSAPSAHSHSHSHSLGYEHQHQHQHPYAAGYGADGADSNGEPIAGPSRPSHARLASLSSLRTSSKGAYASSDGSGIVSTSAPHPDPPYAHARAPSIAGTVASAGTGAAPPISPRSTSLSGRGTGSGREGSPAEQAAPRIPSRQLLQSALDLAQRAVEMDQSNDVLGALAAYREAVSRLRSVMERVGAEDPTGKRRKGRAEEEGRTLKGIHDAYVARIQLLSSYEETGEVYAEGDVADLEATGSVAHAGAGASTSTLVPHPPTGGAEGIGALMLGPRLADTSASLTASLPPTPLETPFSPSDADKAVDVPPRRESLNGLGIGHPTSPPRVETTPSRATHRSSTTSASSIPSTPRRLRMRPSLGLEDEANLTAADGLVDITEAEQEKTLPPVPVVSSSNSGHSRQSSFGRLGQLISSSTAQGTISQRRQRAPPNIAIEQTSDRDSGLPSSKSLAFSRSRLGAGPSQRSRSKSQPGQRPDMPESADDVPPLPNLRNKSSFASQRRESLASPIAIGGGAVGSPHSRAYSYTHSHDGASMTSSLISPVPEVQPQDVAHRAFHILRSLRASMDTDGPGAYLTGSIHVPSAVWNPSAYSRGARLPGPKIVAQDVKVRVIDQVLLHLEILRHTGALLLDGPREVAFGVAGVAPPRVGTARVVEVADAFHAALEAFEDEMDGVYKSLVKGGVVVGGWKGKKASNALSWSSKMARSMDKMSGSKGLESPDKYVDILAALCSGVQTIDDHLHNFTGPCTPAYHTISEQGYRAVEARIQRAAEFVAVVVTPFVLDDFKQFFVSHSARVV